MHTEDEYSKFLKNLGKIVSTQWSKVTKSTPSNENFDTNIDQQLEEEYETLLREIDYLTTEKSCYLSFQNDNFNNVKSSEDLSEIFKKHSSEVLKKYISKHDNKKQSDIHNRENLINYVTEIVISKTKCNNKLCTCKPKKVSKEVFTDGSFPEENGKETQTDYVSDSSAEKATHVRPIVSQKMNQTKSDVGLNKVNTIVQTDDWSHDPLCKCGCCPKTESKVDTKGITTDEKPVREVSTSDRKITFTKDVLANCVGDNAETNTSGRLCAPENFETLIENNKIQTFPICTAMKDCACEVYDVKEALKRGLVLPSDDICIQKNKKSIFSRNKKKMKDDMTDSSEGAETTDAASTSTNRNKKEKKKKDKNEKKETKKKKNSATNTTSSSTPREKTKKKKKEGTTKCFGAKKKKESNCDEYCLGIIAESRSMQTIPIRYTNKNECACLCNENGRKSIQTSTNSETAVQVSARTSYEDLKKDRSVGDNKQIRKTKNIKRDREAWLKDRQDKETWSRPDNFQDREVSPRPDTKQDRETFWSGSDIDYKENKSSKSKKNRDKRKKDDKKDTFKDPASICSKCGRLKRDCVPGCRNTIIIPYGSGSNNVLSPGEVESLRMLIKMQSKDTNRQFDTIMVELNHQKSEVRRLNDMYQKMIETFYGIQKGSNLLKSSKISAKAKECGCSVSNECKIAKKQDMSIGRSYDTTGSNNSNNTYNGKLKRFGPPNTAVAINRCDVCRVEIDGSNIKPSFPANEGDYHDGDKQRKDQLNQFKKENILSGETGNNNVSNTGSVSTIYKKEKKVKKDDQKDKKHRQENKNDFVEVYDETSNPTKEDDIFVIETETDPSDSEKKTRGTYSSRILLWLKKSWVVIKHKREECKRQERDGKQEQILKCMLNFAHDKAKQAATGIWKAAKQTF